VPTDSEILEQARASQSSVLVISELERAAITVAGKDRTSWLNGLVTCDLAKLGPKDGAYGLLVEKKGHIKADLFIVPGMLRTGEPALAVAVPRDARDEIFAILDHHVIMEDVELGTEELAFFAAHGPRALELASVVGDIVLGFRGVLDLLGTGGAVMAVAASARAEIETELAAEATRLGGVMGNRAGWDAVRIERGLPRFGVEFDTTHYPQEASLEKLAVSFSKGCYLGQEVVYMLENRGHVKRKLVSLDVEGNAPPLPGTPITTPEGEAIGDVKSAAIAPLSGKVVAIAMVKWSASKGGTALRVDGRVARVRA